MFVKVSLDLLRVVYQSDRVRQIRKCVNVNCSLSFYLADDSYNRRYIYDRSMRSIHMIEIYEKISEKIIIFFILSL